MNLFFRIFYRYPLFQFIVMLFNTIPMPYLPVFINGHPVFVNKLDRYISLLLRKFRIAEISDLKLMMQQCNPGMTIVDIGANVGLYAITLGDRILPDGQIWAFEPDPENFQALQYNILKNRMKNIHAVNHAVADCSNDVHLYRSKFNSGDHRIYPSKENTFPKLKIKSTSLDHFFPPDQKIDFIKIDIQGAEGLALKGMEKILDNNPNINIIMEFWPQGMYTCGTDPQEVLALLQKHGFLIKYLNSNNCWKILEDMKTLIQTLDRKNSDTSIWAYRRH